ncbi:sulfite exporter TauE/SafE family protein [Bdellovibrio svalbardensis]|uniref:Probable membrane transporter protein n=1 Tax=Bdellovibrio svalbardensis TaxID=2972972 RepID=A0ABT6DLK4_9BACT|nr:sulfite exporter TauE/SafE family protein [Bdellovibrio svalbardensis]MDG0817762.1 sulfite exporter TauE/SafE family protein [Bdellovibrio svalbardensis]
MEILHQYGSFIAGYFGALLIGVSLGVLGGGGSILAVPLLVYLFYVPASLATTYSLFIVGLTSLVGFARAAHVNRVSWKALFGFGIPSLAGLLAVRRLILPSIPAKFLVFEFEVDKNVLIMTSFAVVMLLASISMIRHKGNKLEQKSSLPVSLTKAVLVGGVTGFVGAGGGFLIVPALVVMNRLPMALAVGTSLGVIALNSLLGFTGDAIGGVAIDYLFLLKLAAISVVGIFAGLVWGQKTSEQKLKPAFGYFVLIVGALIFMQQLSKL